VIPPFWDSPQLSEGDEWKNSWPRSYEEGSVFQNCGTLRLILGENLLVAVSSLSVPAGTEECISFWRRLVLLPAFKFSATL